MSLIIEYDIPEGHTSRYFNKIRGDLEKELAVRKTKFGAMANLNFGDAVIWPTFEVMHFDAPGRPHAHHLKEIAICVSGSGFVDIEGVQAFLEPGEMIEIPSGKKHFMVPDINHTFCLVILYKTALSEELQS